MYCRAMSRVVNASSRSKCTVKTRLSGGYSVVIPANSSNTPVISVNPWWMNTSTYTGPDAAQVNQIMPYSTCGTDLYKSFCKLYDSVKVDAVYARITIQNIVGAGGDIAALNVYTAWDRQFNLDDLKYDVYPSFVKMKTLPSATCATISNNTGATIDRFCKASTFMEKYCFIDATQRSRTFPVYGRNVTIEGSESLSYGGGNWPGFCPALYIAFETPHNVPTAAYTIKYVIDYVVYYTFKNPYSSIIS